MAGFRIKDCKFFEVVLDTWRKWYCFLLPVVTVIIYLFGYFRCDFKIWESENFPDSLTSMVTFASIIISFLGVLLTLLISAKEKSRLVNYFLASANMDYFISSIKKLVANGLLTVILAMILFLKDKMTEMVILVCFCYGIYSLMRFAALTYRFTNILLRLLIKDVQSPGKPEGTKLSGEKKKELNERLEKGI